MAALIRIGDCVKIPDGRVARVQQHVVAHLRFGRQLEAYLPRDALDIGHGLLSVF